VLLDIIITWSALDEAVERVRKLLARQPGIKTGLSNEAPFKRRLSNFEQLCTEYFATAPAFVKFLAQSINGIRKLRDDRDLVAHGNYGFRGDGKTAWLVLYMLRSGKHLQKEYTIEQLKEVADKIGWYLFVLDLFRTMSADALAGVLMKFCSVPKSQVGKVQTLLNPIHSPPPSTTP